MARSWIWIVLPLAALGAILAFLLIGKPLDPLTRSAPPVNAATVKPPV